jgi:hypothetical protein
VSAYREFLLSAVKGWGHRQIAGQPRRCVACAIASDCRPARDKCGVSTELLRAGANLCIPPTAKCTPRPDHHAGTAVGFFISVPIGIIAADLALRMAPRAPARIRDLRELDIPGAIALITLLVLPAIRPAGLEVSVSWALDQLSRLKAVEHTWEKEALVVQHTAIDAEAQSILDALGIRMTNRVVRVARPTAA